MVFSGPSGSYLDEQALDQRRQQIADELGVSPDDIRLSVEHAPYSGARRALAHAARPRRELFTSAPLNTSTCPGGNTTQFIITVSFVTSDESFEKFFVETISAAISNATLLTTATGEVFRSCSNPVVESQRLVHAYAPPNLPPIPYVTVAQINSYGTVLIGSAGFLTLFCGLCGQWCFAAGLQRRRKEKKAKTGDAGQSLLDGVSSKWGFDWDHALG